MRKKGEKHLQTLLRRLTLITLLAVVLVVPGLGLAGAPTAYALSCVGFTLEEAYERYDAVIVGQVDAMERVSRTSEYNRTEVTVLRSFKMIEDRQLSVLENMTWGAGFAPSEVGGQYLMYLNMTDEGWEQPLCSPGMLIAHKADELAWLSDKEIALKPLEENSDTTDSGGAIAADNNSSRIIWVISISAIAVTAGATVWFYVARNRKY